MDVVSTLISLVSGAVGGNVAGAAFSEKNLGVIANSIIGLLGGGAGEYLLKALGVIASTSAAAGATGSLDIASILTNIGVSGVSGGVITAIITFIKDAIAKK